MNASISILLSALALSAPAVAEPASTPTTFDLNQLHADILTLGDQTSSCIDISGTWKGFCEEKPTSAQAQSSSQIPTEMTFVQKGCSLIEAAQFGASYLGAVKSESVSSPMGVLSQTGASYWLANGKKLGMDQSYSLVMYGDQGTVSIGKVRGEFFLDGAMLLGKITQNVSRMGMAGQYIGTVNSESDCRLERQ